MGARQRKGAWLVSPRWRGNLGWSCNANCATGAGRVQSGCWRLAATNFGSRLEHMRQGAARRADASVVISSRFVPLSENTLKAKATVVGVLPPQ